MHVRFFLLLCTLLPASASAADCVGMLNQAEQGYKLEGDRLEPSGPKVASGTELEFTGIGRYKDRFFLTRARSEVFYDAQNVALGSACDLQTRELPRAR